MNPVVLPPIFLTRLRLIAIMVITLCAGVSVPAQSDVSSPPFDRDMSRKLFAQVPFAQWEKQGPAREIPWKVSATGSGLSFQQRLVSKIAVALPGSELIRRRKDGDLILLVQVTDATGHAYRNFAILELQSLKPELAKSDVIFISRVN